MVTHVVFLTTPSDSGTKISTIKVEDWAFNIRTTNAIQREITLSFFNATLTGK